jgi:hypothetical protein
MRPKARLGSIIFYKISRLPIIAILLIVFCTAIAASCAGNQFVSLKNLSANYAAGKNFAALIMDGILAGIR